jgi:hypothetical protein
MSNITTVVPLIDVNLQHRDVNIAGPQEFTIRQYPSTSYSQNNATFSLPPPSNQVFMDRCMMVALPITVTYAGTTTGSALLETGKDALRAYPIHSIINTIQLSVNDRQFTIQANEIIHPTSHYRKPKDWDLSPEFLDKYQVYGDGVLGNNNPLGTYLDSMNPNFPLRGSFPMTITNGATSSTLVATPVEPLYIPPLLCESESELGFSNLISMSVTLNYASNLSRIVSHAASNATFSGISVVLGQPTLYVKYLTPQQNYVPRPLSFGSQQINYCTTPAATLTANATATLTSTNMQLECVPSHMYIFCREANANLTYASTDTYTSIENISLTFNNKTGILSSASKYDLYQISKENGLQDNWSEFSGIVQSAVPGTVIGTIGSVLRLDFAKNIPLNDVHVGQAGSFNMQFQVGVKNVNQSASIIAPTLYCIVITPSKFTIDVGGATYLRIGMTNEEGEYIAYDAVKKYYGGSFKSVMGKIGNFLKPVVGYLRDSHAISTIASQIPHPAAQAFATAAKSLGFGNPMVGGTVGGMDVGGMRLTRQDLINRIRRA